MRPDPIKRWQGSWCPHCHAPAGPDCTDVALDRRAAAKKARRAWKKEARRAWKKEAE